MKFFKIFLWGLMISFLGSLPLGTLNIAAWQIGHYETIENAIYFSIGSLLVEMIYVRISLVGIDWISKQVKLMRMMQWITFSIILALAIGSFISASQSSAEHEVKNKMLDLHIHRFLLGVFMSAINPVQIPFWFGWSTVLFSKKILEPKNNQYNFYIVGIGLGTLCGNGVFIFGGEWLVSKIPNSGAYLNWVIGGIFALTAIIQLIKIFSKKPPTNFS